MRSNYPFPNDNIDPKIKEQKETGLKVAKAININNLTLAETTTRIKKIQDNRDFASNNQSVEPYKPLLNAAIDQKGDSSYINIDWSISTPAKKFVDTVIGDIINPEYKCSFDAISPYTKAKKDAEINSYYAKLAMAKDFAELEAQTGVPLMDRSGFNPQDEEEIELYRELELKLGVEIGMEEIVDFEFYNNDYDTKIKNRAVRDLVENNECRARLYFDENNKIRIRYTDIINYFSSYSNEPDNSDVEYEAELVYLPIRELRLRDVNKTITEEQWAKVAQQNAGQYGNSEYVDNINIGESTFEDFRIPCLDFVWYTNNKYFYEERTSGKGRNYFDEKPFNHTSKKHNIVVKEREVSYDGIWVKDTDILLGYELSKNMLRLKDPYNTNKTSPKLIKRYVGFKIKSKSIVDVMKPNLNTIQLLVLRKRHLISEMNPTGVAIDVSGLKSVMAALKETDPMKIPMLYKQKGILFYSRTDVNGDPTNGIPIQELNSSSIQHLLSIDQSIISEINIIRENIGINDARDSSKPDNVSLVGIEKLKLLASNNTTRELYRAYTTFFTNCGKIISKMIQYKFVYGEGEKDYEDVIGKYGVKAVEFAKDIELCELGIKIEALPTAEDIQDLVSMLNMALQNQEISADDYLKVKSILNVKKAIKYLNQRKKRYAQEKMAEFQQREQITAEREKSSIMASAEAEQTKQQAKVQAEIMKMEAEMRVKKELDDHLTFNKMKLIDRESYWDMKKIEQAKSDEDETANTSESPTQGIGAAGEKIFSDPVRSATRTDTMM